MENETQREGYILNLQDGSTLRVNDVPLLADVSIGQISSLDDCKTFLITTESPNASNSMMRVVSSIRPTYLFDLPTRSAEYLGELSGMVWMKDDGDLYYQTQRPNTDIVQIFRRTVRPLGEPIFVKEITAADAMYVSWASDLSYATYLESSSRSYWGPVNYVDANSGRNYELTSPDEFVQTYAQTTWQALKSGRQP